MKFSILVFAVVALTSCIGSAGQQTSSAVCAGGFRQDASFDRFAGKAVSFSFKLDELASARDEDERYAPVAGGGVNVDHSCVRRAHGDAWDACATVTNRSDRPRFLRLVFRAKVPFAKFTFWNGYLNQGNVENISEGPISSLFPAIAAVADESSLVLGLDPMMMAARVDTSCEKAADGESLVFAFPVYLPPGDGFTARMTLASAPSRYLWHDVVERWYELFPKAFAPAESVHPGVLAAEASYLFWKPQSCGITSNVERAKAIRKAHEKGASVRQLVRVTGVSKGLIEKYLKAEKTGDGSLS